MENSLEKIKNHVEFLGYECELDDDVLSIKKEDTSILIRKLSYAVIHTSFWKINKNIDDNLYKIINSTNTNSVIALHRINEEQSSLVIEAFYAGEYSKITYAKFLEAFIKDDDDQLLDNKELLEYLK